MYTFSQLVDSIVNETKRPDLVSFIASYLNQTIRECHFTADKNAAIFFDDNLQEQLLTTNTADSYVWEIPNPTNFQKMGTAQYQTAFDRDGSIWPKETTPGRHLRGLCNYYYRVSGTFVFVGYGGLNAKIALTWYEFPVSLKYKAAAARPASYDVESGWSYASGIDTDELQAGARALTANWLLLRWSDVLAEGLRAKIYKRLSDTERARTCYSLYGSLRQGLATSETAKLYGG